MTKVAIYCRLSEEDRNKISVMDDSNSIQNQKVMLTEYAHSQGWVIYDIYSDDDYTGADRKRPQFCRLLQEAEQRKFQIVLCKTQSRFTRELELVEKYIHGLFPVWGIRFVGLVDNADTDNRGNKKSRQINGLVNEWYLEDMSDSIKSALTCRRKQGYHIGAFALYGYKKDPEQKGHLVIDEEAAAIVQEVFQLYVAGYGKTYIAKMLNARGVPNPTEYKRLHGLRYKVPRDKNSTLWKYYAISSMLTNEIYIGNMVQGKYGSVSYKTKSNKPRPKSEWYIVEGTHEPIIDRTLWDNAQSLIKQRTKPFSTGAAGIFSGKVRCANCGYVMRSGKYAPQRGGKRFLTCTTRYIADGACIGAFISMDRLEQMIINEINRLSAEYLDKDELERNIEYGGHLQEQKLQLQVAIEKYQHKLDDYGKAIKNLYMDKVRGVISEVDYEEMSADFGAERERLGCVVADGQRQLTEIEEKIVAGDNRKELIEKYTNLDHLTREVVDVLIDYISVDKRIPGTRNVPIEIHWNF